MNQENIGRYYIWSSRAVKALRFTCPLAINLMAVGRRHETPRYKLKVSLLVAVMARGRELRYFLCWFPDPWSHGAVKRGVDDSWMRLQHQWEAQSYMSNKDSWTSYRGHCYLITLSSSPACPPLQGETISLLPKAENKQAICYLGSYQFYCPRHWAIKVSLLMSFRRGTANVSHWSRLSHETHRRKVSPKSICALG